MLDEGEETLDSLPKSDHGGVSAGEVYVEGGVSGVDAPGDTGVWLPSASMRVENVLPHGALFKVFGEAGLAGTDPAFGYE